MTSENTIDETIEPTTPNDIDVQHVEALGQDVIEAVKTLRELLAERAEELKACRTDLQSRQKDLAGRQQVLDEQEDELAKDLEERENELAARETHCKEIEQQVEQLAASQQEQTAEFNAQKVELAAQQKQISTQLDELTLKDKDLTDRTVALAEKEKLLQANTANLDDKAASLKQQRAELEAMKQQAEQDREQFEQYQSERNERQATLEKAQAEVQEQLLEAQQQCEALQAEKNDVADQRRDALAARTEVAALAETLDARQQELEKRERHVAKVEQDCSVKATTLEAAMRQLTVLQAKLQSELDQITVQQQQIFELAGSDKETTSSEPIPLELTSPQGGSLGNCLAAMLEDRLSDIDTPYSIGELLLNGKTDITLLRAVKSHAKHVARATKDSHVNSAANVVYHAAIASALVVNGHKISVRSYKKLGLTFAKMERVPGVGDELRDIFARAQSLCSQLTG